MEKPKKLENGAPVLRCIMNLTGSNSTQVQLEGGTDSLPSITSWQSLVIDEGEVIETFQSDYVVCFLSVPFASGLVEILVLQHCL